MTKLHSFLEVFCSNYPGVDPTATYCLATGRMIGANYEVTELVESSDMDLEELADDIAMRLFAAMRPGIFWNKMTLRTVGNLQVTRPTETLAWLLNRLMNPPEFKGSIFAIHHDRILTFQWCESLSAETITRLVDALLNVDARLNLNAMSDGPTLDTLLFDGVAAIDTFVTQANIKADKREKAMEMQTRWYRDGNTLSRAATVESFFRKRAESPSPAKAASTEKAKTAIMMDNILAALMTGTATPDSRSVETPKATPAPAATPKSGGLAFLKKKAS